MAKRIASLLFGLLVLSAMPSVFAERNLTRPPGTTRYAGMVGQLQSVGRWDRAQGYHRFQLSSIGSSVDGRSIWMVTLHDPSTPPGKKIFYLCRQHGHEPASTEGALSFIDELVHAAPANELAQCLSNVTVYVVPMANPDGAERFIRHNAHNVDLNRDWLTRSQPETRALWRAIQDIHPDVITDQHELFPDDSRPDFTESAGPKAGASTSMLPICEPVQEVVHLSMTADGFPNRSYEMDSPKKPHLLHKFGCLVAGIPTILFETNRSSPSRTVRDRAEAHEQFMRIMLRDTAGEQETLLSEAYRVLGNRPGLTSTTPTGSGEDKEGQ